jgi:hypothetical protein
VRAANADGATAPVPDARPNPRITLDDAEAAEHGLIPPWPRVPTRSCLLASDGVAVLRYPRKTHRRSPERFTVGPPRPTSPAAMVAGMADDVYHRRNFIAGE